MAKMNQMMKQAQQMQLKMASLQKELDAKRVYGKHWWRNG